MAVLSTVTYSADGATDTFSIPFGYLKPEHIKVTVNGTSATFTFNSSSVIKLDTMPANADEVRVYRDTPKDVREVVFKNPSIQDASDFNLNSDQLFYVMQEAFSTVERNKAELEDLVTDTEEAIRVDISSNDTDIAALQGRVTTVEDETDTNTNDIGTLNGVVAQHSSQLNALTTAPDSPTEGGVGSIVMATTNPDVDKYVEAGETLSRLAYPDLFQSLGNEYRVLNGVTQQTVAATGIDAGDTLSTARYPDGTLMAQVGVKVFLSSDNGTTWTQAPGAFEGTNPEADTPVVVNGNLSAAKGNITLLTGSGRDDRVIFSLNNGIDWDRVTLPQYESAINGDNSVTVKAIFPYKAGFLILGYGGAALSGYELLNYTEDFATFTTLDRLEADTPLSSDFDTGMVVGDTFVLGMQGFATKAYLEIDVAQGTYRVVAEPSALLLDTMTYSPYLGEYLGLATVTSLAGTYYDSLVSVVDESDPQREVTGVSGTTFDTTFKTEWLSGTAVVALQQENLQFYPDGFETVGTKIEGVLNIGSATKLFTDGDEVLVSGTPEFGEPINRFTLNYDADLFRTPYIKGIRDYKAYIKKVN